MAGEAGSDENVAVEREDGITWLILNRPEKRNATNPPLPLSVGATCRQ